MDGLPDQVFRDQDGITVGSGPTKSIAGTELRQTRKPRLLFRFAGSFLLRFAVRQFAAELFQLPPRFTRFEPSDRSPPLIVSLQIGIASSKYSRCE